MNNPKAFVLDVYRFRRFLKQLAEYTYGKSTIKIKPGLDSWLYGFNDPVPPRSDDPQIVSHRAPSVAPSPHDSPRSTEETHT